jgi:hypothetical protein
MSKYPLARLSLFDSNFPTFPRAVVQSIERSLQSLPPVPVLPPLPERVYIQLALLPATLLMTDPSLF